MKAAESTTSQKRRTQVEPKTYRPKPSHATIEAVQLTEENADEVARWCFGDVIRWKQESKGESFRGVQFEIAAGLPGAIRRITAYPGDYVVKTGPNGPFNFTVMGADTLRYQYEDATDE